MRMLTTLSCAFFLAALGTGTALAQEELPPPRLTETPAEETPPASPVLSNGLSRPGDLSSWILYNSPCCCYPLGKDGPIGLEVYFRTGISRPIAGGDVFNHALSLGWVVEGGGRSLFFNEPGNAAWTIGIGISHHYNNGGHENLNFVLADVPIPNPNFNPFDPNSPQDILANTIVTIRSLNRTYANASVGREWFLPLPWFGDQANWRWGVDAGGRWGTANLQVNDPSETSNFRRITDVIGSAFLAGQVAVEVPFPRLIFFTGLRGEWNYTWMDIMKGLDNDFQEINLLWTVGCRF